MVSKETLERAAKARKLIVAHLNRCAARRPYVAPVKEYKQSPSCWAGPGIAVRTSKPGPTGAGMPNSLVSRTDQTDLIAAKRIQRRKVLNKLKGE